MIDKKKASTSSAKPVETAGQGNFSGYSNPTNDSTTKAPGVQVTISDFLHAGRENALPLAVLCQLTGMDGRQVRLCIQRERLMGEPILSDNAHGYYLPGSEREVREFIRSMRHRAREIEKAAGVIEGVYYGR